MKSFREVAAASRMPRQELTHTQRVTRLYRNALRLQFSWAVQRSIYLEEAEKIRARFDALKNEPKDSLAVKLALQEGEAELAEKVHPDPYVVCWMPGGSKFMRNAPPPPPKGYDLTGTNTPVWPDMVPITYRPTGKIDSLLVDWFWKVTILKLSLEPRPIFIAQLKF